MVWKIFFLGLVSSILSSCASAPSGRYITLKEPVSVQAVAKAYKVSPQAVRAYNPKKSFQKGDKIFIPSKVGIANSSRRPASAVIDLFGRETFIWPIKGNKRISSFYGVRKLFKRRKMHHGIDIAAPRGTEILAVADGEVTVAGRPKGQRALSGYGKMVIIKHDDNIHTVYAHASQVLVEYGQRVKQGDPIALVGSTGRSSGAHLHFEFRRAGQSIDPKLVYEEQNGLRQFDIPVFEERLSEEEDEELAPENFSAHKHEAVRNVRRR
jgi:murein DD-endopeptidase MepM/ murein hydrolase activator NlpD